VDHGALEHLYRTYGPLVLRRARAVLGDEQAAKDALQEVFMRVYESQSEFREQASPTTWLYRITTNHCLNLIRDRARRAELLEQRVAPAAAAGQDGPETRATLAQILARVPEDLREIGIYYYVDEMNQDEIAALLGVSRRTVGYRIEAFCASAQGVVAAKGVG